ncbi:DUF4411 family protein [Methanolobus sp. WCC1]|uniref:DUF4411 family protein n=1 Tax=unclassified Methanolobus TaxID=2629569 RepID=UPI00324F2599
MERSVFYVIDTSSLIDMGRNYPMSIFPSFWRKFEELIHHHRIAAPDIVLSELERQDDELTDWAKIHSQILFRDSSDMYLRVIDILSEFPKLIDPNDDHEQADPFLIAMALEITDGPQKSLFDCPEVVIVTQERYNGKRSKKTKIPQVCTHYNIPCIQLLDLITNEGWEF